MSENYTYFVRHCVPHVHTNTYKYVNINNIQCEGTHISTYEYNYRNTINSRLELDEFIYIQ